MKKAFDEDARIHLGVETGGSEGYDNGDFIRKWYCHDDKLGAKYGAGQGFDWRDDQARF